MSRNYSVMRAIEPGRYFGGVNYSRQSRTPPFLKNQNQKIRKTQKISKKSVENQQENQKVKKKSRKNHVQICLSHLPLGYFHTLAEKGSA